MADTVEIQSREVLSDDKFSLQKITYKAAGNDKPINREIYLPPDSATALLYNIQKKSVLLTRQFRLAAFVNGHPTGMLLETCAGNIDKGETPEATITREIEEETGYQIPQVQKLFALYSTPGSVTEQLHYFLAAYNAENKTGKGGGLAEENEHIEVIELPFEEAYSKISSGEIVDAKTVLLLEWAKANIFK